MPIQFNEENGGKILVIHITGKLVKADYPDFVAKFEQLVQQHGKLRVLFDMTGFHGWDVGAAWEDFKFDIKHYADIERLAMVGEKKWQHGMAMFFKPFTKATTRYFDRADAAEARKWLDESEIASADTTGRHILNHKFVLPEGILILEPESPLVAADFAALGRQIDPYIAAHGNLPGLMIHAKVFPGWTNLKAFLAHVRFIEGHLQKVHKLAVVSDSPVLGEVPKIVAPLVHAEVKHFPESEYEAALQWLKAPVGEH
jgi:hypothetical protein